MRTLRLICAGILLAVPARSLQAAGERRSEHSRALTILAQASGLLPEGGEAIKCGLPLLAYAQRHRGTPTPGLLEALDVLDERPTLQTSTLAGHFRIHYDTTGINVPGLLNDAHDTPLPGTYARYVDSVVASAAYVYHVEVDSLGYSPPPDDAGNGGGPEFDIYVLNLANAGYPAVYGFTAPDSNVMIDGGRSSSFIVIDNTFLFVQKVTNRGMRALHVTLGHEFHHAIQIGGYGYWSSEVYYHEITSVWMEAVCYPDVDDYIQYVQSSSGQFANPGVPFNTSSIIMYSRGIWGHFIAKRFGPEAMRRSWEEIQIGRAHV